MIKTILAAVCFAIGIVFFVSEAVGLFHFRYALDRIHVIGMGDTMGMPFIAIGAIILNGFTLASVKLILIGVFMMLSGPVLTHLIGEMEVLNNELSGDNSHYNKEDR